MKKIILGLSLFFSLMGIIRSYFFVFYDFSEVTDFLSFIIFNIQAYSFAGLEIYVKTHLINGRLENDYISMALLNLSFFLTFLAGTIIYYFSHYKETRLLKFNYSLVFLNSMIYILSLIINLKENKLNIYAFIYILLALLYIYISYRFITKDLNAFESKILADEKIKNDDDLKNVSNNKRFLNLFIDNTLIFVVSYKFIEYAERHENINTIFTSFKSIVGEKFSALLFFCIIKFIYYVIFELVFKSTPGKFLTGCYVTDEDGDIPTSSAILKRTVCRFIPLESFSFFAGINIHDNYSSTIVTNNKKDLTNEKLYLYTLVINFIIILIIYSLCQYPY
ncbi:RDD family protein [Flavobacterium sp. 270]|uniref:RDD family protein n=1 Tax=Flavobacterium sp. 270 TaxID=2512114 RepID=UPI0010661CFF|nr:RDD family protein [Flavobacterium sp. 270]TDW51984.1 RDD family protein [Flavobacterium sp. 270]